MIRFAVPTLLLMAIVVGLFYFYSNHSKQFEGEDAPKLTLSPLNEHIQSFSNEDLKGKVILVHFFATWCPHCRREHKFLKELAEKHNVLIYGITYKERAGQVWYWLEEHGNPYARIGHDFTGQTRIDWQVRAIPQTFIISPQGKVAYQHRGSLSADSMANVILPKIDALR